MTDSKTFFTRCKTKSLYKDLEKRLQFHFQGVFSILGHCISLELSLSPSLLEWDIHWPA